MLETSSRQIPDMFQKKPSRRLAIILGLVVSVLWSISWVLIKIGLEGIPPITFAGLRYFLAFLCLLPLLFQKSEKENFRTLKPRDWMQLSILGIFTIAITQGAQFLGLHLLPAASVSLIYNMSPLLVTIGGIAFLTEFPTWMQWLGILLNIIGVIFYFFPFAITADMGIGLVVALIGLFGNSLATLMGRRINYEGRITPAIITTISIGIGSIIMLITGLTAEVFPRITATQWFIIAWMAVINTAFAFLVWNYIQKTLTAVEASMINGTMLIQVAILAWVFLEESLSSQQVVGMVLAFTGILLVQLKQFGLIRRNGISEASKQQ